MKLLAIALVLEAASAHASTVKPLSPAQLEAGADRIVDGTVIARSTAWNRDHTGLETTATIAIEATHKGAPAASVEVVVPGGELDGGTQIIIGMPSVGIGERARWFLRDRGDGKLRVYGWAQGKWPVTNNAFAPDPVRAEHDPRVAEFVTNGMVWPAAKIPVPYLIQNAGTPDLAMSDEIAAIDAAFATWQNVPCASLAFTNAGMTDLGVAIDGNNVLLFVESNWTYGNEAAAATSLYIIDGAQTADIAFNDVDFKWAIAPPGDSIDQNILDLQAVLTHESGHFSGLGHSMRAFDTMYYAWDPWPGQRTLSADDKLGLCSIYPVMGDECPPACPTDEACKTETLGTLCEGTPDPVGAPCNYDRVECDAFCLYTAADLSSGYCSKFCTTDADCPLTHHCGAASSSGQAVMVCLVGAQVIPGACTANPDCPPGQYCNGTACTFDCRTDADCGAGGTCDSLGQCMTVKKTSGGGCAAGGGAALPLVLLVLISVSRRGRSAGPLRARGRR